MLLTGLEELYGMIVWYASCPTEDGKQNNVEFSLLDGLDLLIPFTSVLLVVL